MTVSSYLYNCYHHNITDSNYLMGGGMLQWLCAHILLSGTTQFSKLEEMSYLIMTVLRLQVHQWGKLSQFKLIHCLI